MINDYNKYIQVTDAYNTKKPVMKETKDNKLDSERSEESNLYWLDMFNETCDKKFEIRMKIEKMKKKIERLEKQFASLEVRATLLSEKIK